MTLCSAAEPPIETSRPSVSVAHGRTRPWPWLVAIMVCSLVIDLICFRGFTSYDDGAYFSATTRLLETGRLDNDLEFGKDRLVILGWNCLVARVFGANVQVIAGSYLFFHQLLIVLTFLLGRRTFDRTAGLVAAYYVATIPLIILYSTSIYPDLPLACFLVLSLLAFNRGYDLERQGRRGASQACIFAAGVSVGLGYCTKESGLVLLPFFFVAWLWNEGLFPFRFRRESEAASRHPARSRRAWTTGLLFVLGFFAVYAAEWAVFALLSDKPFFRLGWAMRESFGHAFRLQDNGGIYPLERFKVFLKNHNGLHFPASLKVLFLAGGLLYPLLHRGKWSIPLAGVWLFTYLLWGSMSLRQYYPPSLLPRYLIAVLPFACLVLAGVCANLLQRVRRAPVPLWLGKSLCTAAVAVLVLIPLFNLQVADQFAGRPSASISIANTARAIEVARGAARKTGKPIVLSFLISTRIEPLLYGHRSPDLLFASELTKPDLERLLTSGGFYYIDDSPNLLKAEKSLDRWRNPVDDALHGIILTRSNPWTPWREGNSTGAEMKLAAAAMSVYPIEPEEWDLAVIELASFSATPSRMAELGIYLFKNIPMERRTCDPIWTVELYHIMARRQTAAPADETSQR